MPSEDVKRLKKEEVEDKDEKAIGSLKKKKNKDSNATPAKVKKDEAKKVKKEEADDDLEKPSPKKGSKKSSDKVQKKKKEEEKKKRGTKGAVQNENAKKREKKVYDLPGQKRDPPDDRDPLTIFYKTLYEQVPNSEMAAIWMMESGLLSKEEAKKAFAKKQIKTQHQKLSSPMKAVVTVKRKGESVTINKKTSSSPATTQQKKTTSDSKVNSKPTKKRKNKESSSEEQSDDDFVVEVQKSKKRKAG